VTRPRRKPAPALAAQPQLVGPETCLTGGNCGKGWSITSHGLSVCGQCRRPAPRYLEAMMTISQTSETRVYACGFCATGAHHNCSFATRNGEGKLTFCGCRADVDHAARCTLCNRRSRPFITTTGNELPVAEIDPQEARCTDLDDCLSYREGLAASAAASFGRATPAVVFVEAGGDHGKDLEQRGGQLGQGVRGSSQTTTTTARRKPASTTRSDTTMSDTTSTFRVKAGGGKGEKIMTLIRDTKNHGKTRVELAELAGATVGRVGEVIRYEAAEGNAADKKAVAAFLAAVPGRKTAEPKAKATKAPATKKTAAAKPAAKKTAAKAPAKKTAAVKKTATPKAKA
jgi:hypothetical protein